ncbi:MAG: hypothetical protein ACR2PK_07050 [Acidimicrobiales bacterium]
MIVEVDLEAGPRVIDADVLDAFSVAAITDDSDTVGRAMGPAGYAAEEPGHVWVSADWIRVNAAEASSDPSWANRFEAMLDYAATKNWMNASRSHILAHIESD